MSDVTETPLPGVGVRHEFTTASGERVGVISHRGGRREVLVYDLDDPDACTTVLNLTSEDTRTMAELLGASQVSEAVSAVQYQVEGLAIDWIRIPDGSSQAGRSLAEGMYRTKTGASIVAVVRDETTVPAPGPDFAFAAGDVVVAVATTTGLDQLREMLES
ncbi:MAG: TrkA C-terminal domain-containing protein [Actinomycetota bacterium]|nr:TrkA C-terminal domain-containing protein [Actinomycetota bacterium]